MTSGKELGISVVIPTYNRAERLFKTLQGFDEQTLGRSRFEVLVVDDGSTDDTPRVLARMEGEAEFDLISHRQPNQGPAAAKNWAIERATRDLVIFLNDDTRPEPELLAHHVDWHGRKEGEKQDLVVQGNIVWAEPASEFMRFLSPNGPLFKHGSIRDAGDVSFDFFVTANVSVRKKWLDRESFDSRFPYPAYEDSELGYRLVEKLGLRMVYCADAVVFHDHPHYLESYLEKIVRDGISAQILYRMYIDHPEDRKILKRYVPYLMVPFGRPAFFVATWLLGELGLARLLGRKWWWYFKICHHHVCGAYQGLQDLQADGKPS